MIVLALFLVAALSGASIESREIALQARQQIVVEPDHLNEIHGPSAFQLDEPFDESALAYMEAAYARLFSDWGRQQVTKEAETSDESIEFDDETLAQMAQSYAKAFNGWGDRTVVVHQLPATESPQEKHKRQVNSLYMPWMYARASDRVSPTE